MVMDSTMTAASRQEDPMVLTGDGYTQVIPSMHMDYIHQIALDVYGRRMATCSGDRFVRVWELNDFGQWTLTAQWQAHRGSISSLCWAHPEFGNLLATCGSSDHDAKIWEETSGNGASAGGGTGSGGGSNNPTPSTPFYNNSNNNNNNNIQNQVSSSRWTNKASLGEARRAVTCGEFAPRHWGLKLAAGSADGFVRIYEAVDIMNLSQWPLAATLQCFSDDQDTAATYVAKSSSKGSNVGASGSSNASTNAASNIMNKTNTATAADSSVDNQIHPYHTKELGCTAVSWCTGRFEPPTLVVAGSTHLIVYRYSETARAWQSILNLPPADSGIAPSLHVLDVEWAPNVGRRYHYIAAAEEDTLRIYKLSRQTATVAPDTSSQPQQQSQQKQQPQQLLALESSQTINTNAWRCQWNVTGTVLASSGDGGVVQLWKADYNGRFGCVGKVQGDLTRTAAMDGSNKPHDGGTN